MVVVVMVEGSSSSLWVPEVGVVKVEVGRVGVRAKVRGSLSGSWKRVEVSKSWVKVSFG